MKRIGKYFVVFLIPVVCMIIHMALTDCYPFGANTILMRDANEQYLSFFKELYDKLAAGESILFSWNKGMGYDSYITFCYYLGSPLSWPALLFGKDHMELGMIFIMLLQLGGCGITALYYFIHTDKNKLPEGKSRTAFCMVFATAYAMCNYILAYQYNLMWLISLMLLPLVLLGVERLVSTGDVRLYFVVLFLALASNYYFAWFVCMFSVLCFIDQRKESLKEGLRIFVKYALSSIVAAMCAAFVLIPCYLFVLQRQDQYMLDTEMGLLGNIGDFFQGMLWAGTYDSFGASLFTYNAYFGVFALSLAVFYFFRSDIPVTQRIKRALEIIVLSFCLNWSFAIYALHGFSFPHMFAGRFAILLVLLFLVTGFEGVQALKTVRYRYMAGAFAILLGILCFSVFVGSELQEFYCYMVSAMVIFYLFICLFLYKRNSIKLGSVYINIIILGFVELISNFFFVNPEDFSKFRERVIYADQWKEAYADMDRDTGERNTSWMYDQNCFTYSESNIFSSAINSNMVWFFRDLGMTYQNNGGSYVFRGTTPVTDLLFNVKNVLTNQPSYYGGYNLIEEKTLTTDEGIETYGVYTTDYLAGFGFVLPESVLEWNTDGNPFEVQNYFTNEILGEGDVFTKVNIELIATPSLNCVVTNYADNSVNYYNTNVDGDSFAVVAIVFDIPYDMNLYAYLHDENLLAAGVDIDGEEMITGIGSYFSPGLMLNFGDVKEGQNVILSMHNASELMEKGITSFEFYIFHDDVMQACVEKLRTSALNIEKFDAGKVKGNIQIAEDGVLYLSVPVYDGFKAYVDGKQTEIIAIGGALIGIPVTAGTHDIELKYFPYGLKTGIIISVTGVIFACLFYIWEKRKRRISNKSVIENIGDR